MTVLLRSFGSDLHVRDSGDGRTVTGLCVPYNVEVRVGRYVESFAPGAFAGTDPALVPFTATHPRDGGQLPIGRATELRDQPDGLWGDFRVSKTAAGDDVLELVRDGAVTGLSVGFIPVTDRGRQDRGRVERVRATLDHVAVVRVPQYPSARIAALRHAQEQDGVLLRLARLR